MLKEKENFQKEAKRNYNLYKEMKEENSKLHKTVKELKHENKTLAVQVAKLMEFESKYKEMQCKHFSFSKSKYSVDMNESNLTSADLRSEKENFVKGMDVKGHPLVPKLDFEKIYAWREQQDLDDGADEYWEEEEEEEELQTA